MNHLLRQRGSIIIYAMLTMSAMLAIGLTLSGLFIGKLKSAAGARNSTTALYVADSVVEMCLYEARNTVDEPPMIFSNGATYEITGGPADTDITDDCSTLGSGSFDFRATGSYRGVRRTLEITQ
jgi:hypothetical protein